MKCANCGYENLSDMRFCGQCGTQLGQVCDTCGFTNPPDHRFCGQCGTQLFQEAISEERITPAAQPPAPVPPVQVPELSAVAPIQLAGKRRLASVIFVDVANSTDLLERIGTEFIVPMRTRSGNLSGLLILGPKLSGQPYSIEDKELIHTICNQMSTNLENARLFAASQQEVDERKRAEEELKQSHEQLRNLSAHIESMREAERTSIAREFHDELGQSLTALNMDLAWLNKRMPEQQEALIKKTQEMSKLISTTIQTVKRISTELRPGVLDDLGLIAAIEWQAQEFQGRTQIKCELTTEGEDIDLDRDLATTVFRIFQEAITNVARHANATVVKVNLKKEKGQLVLQVQDNGDGITKKQIAHPKSFGLIGMRERARLWNGNIKINGISGKGTTITAIIPLK